MEIQGGYSCANIWDDLEDEQLYYKSCSSACETWCQETQYREDKMRLEIGRPESEFQFGRCLTV